MGAYNRTNGEPCCGSPALQKSCGRSGALRAFRLGLLGRGGFPQHHKVTARPEESVKLALENGCDVNCGCTYQKILNAVNEGLLDRKTWSSPACGCSPPGSCWGCSTRRPTTPWAAGTWRPRAPGPVGKDGPGEPGAAEKRRRPLPLALKQGMTIAVVGPNAGSRRALMGNYHGTASRYIPVLEGIQDAAERAGARVLYARAATCSSPTRRACPAKGATAPRSWRPSARAWSPCPRPSGWRSSTTWPGPTTCPTASPRPSPRPPAPT